jgi:hypothetical protein
MMFLQEVLDDLGTWCDVSTRNDLKKVIARVEGEGDQFLTITLPSFGKDFERSLDLGIVNPSSFKGFPFRGKTPIFLGGFMDLVFDRDSGVLLDEPSIAAIRAIRQFTLMWAKIQRPVSEKREAAAFKQFVQTDSQVREPEVGDRITATFRIMASRLWGDILRNVENDIKNDLILPKHGPGATAEKLVGNHKYNQLEWPVRLNDLFPWGRFLSNRWISPECTDFRIDLIEPGQERPVRVVAVPKTQSTPRIISIEPTCMQYVQQGLMESIERSLWADNTARDLIGYRSQLPNQQLALQGSLSGNLATLDLSEASDRVAYGLAKQVFADSPLVWESVDACRSKTAEVLGHGVIHLKKFASMGSALTFPVEAMVFMTIIMTAISEERSTQTRLSTKDIKSLVGQVRVYGDDIIVPVEYVSSVVSLLEAYGLKVNSNKSFWNGKFRESCGKEFYDGHDVTLTRVRRDLPTSRKHTDGIVSTVSLRNLLFERGFVKAVAWLDDLIEGLIPFPEVEPGSPILGRWSYSKVDLSGSRMDRNLHIPLVRGCVVTVIKRKTPLDGYGALMKYFLKRGEEPTFDAEHLLYGGRPVSVDIKTRWASPIGEVVAPFGVTDSRSVVSKALIC